LCCCWERADAGKRALGRVEQSNAHPYTNENGPHPWLVEHLGKTDFIPAWREVLKGHYQGMLDLAVITTPDSRLDNYYLEGLAFLLRETDIDGLLTTRALVGNRSSVRIGFLRHRASRC